MSNKAFESLVALKMYHSGRSSLVGSDEGKEFVRKFETENNDTNAGELCALAIQTVAQAIYVRGLLREDSPAAAQYHEMIATTLDAVARENDINDLETMVEIARDLYAASPEKVREHLQRLGRK